MVSLWGTKNKKDGGEDQVQHHGEGSNDTNGRRSHDADERTRLLPSQRNDGYLDPDDPAVRAISPWGISPLQLYLIKP